MQYAEKVALVPQHYVEDREYKQIQNPGTAVARGTLSLDSKRILNDKNATTTRRSISTSTRCIAT